MGSIWAALGPIWARFGKFLVPLWCQVGAILGQRQRERDRERERGKKHPKKKDREREKDEEKGRNIEIAP